jgi:type I restriction enzyme S subunit
MRKYQKYKKSNLLGIEDAPIQWTEKRMKHIAAKKRFAIVDGPFGTQLKADEYTESGVPLIRISDLNWGGTIETEELKYISEEKSQELLRSSITTDDIIIAKTGATIGKSVLNNKIEFGIIASSCLKISPNKKEVEPWFLNYLISSKEAQELIILMSGGSTRDTINTQPLANIKFYWPSLPEQHAIVRFLDYKTGQIDNFIANRQKQIELLKEQKAGIINKAVTKGIDTNVKMKDSGIEWIERIPENWSIWKLKYLTKKISKGTTPSTEGREILEAGEIRFLKAENITPEGISLLPEFFIDEETNQILKRSQLQKNDILFVIAGATIGKAAIITDEFIPSNTNQAVCFIRLKKNVLPELILNQLQASYIKNKMAVESVVAAQPNISMEKIGNFQIFLPPMHEQVLLLKFVQEEANNFNTLISKYQKQIELMQEYRTSLISQAVTGKIDVREWQPKKQQEHEPTT